ncbi:hypothetical protein [Bosea sp. NBC_00550]|uniref:hypothetical protein n=1 Tax=Bosea sp. NBC_00550 TaxID=2969621 RepID=UPI00223190B2|nr:hypothetical protein [Bosea sp. NBC_00550]UZF90423.1 hypothetical protein NWE53_14830 [Bosea sp. NBC_00550]
MVALQAPDVRVRRSSTSKRELYREDCQDEEGNRYTVIVWQNKPGLSTVSYTLDDGTPLHYEDKCYFALPSGRMLTRCDD